MISKIYIDRAMKIRKEYNSLNKDATNYKKMIESLKDKLEETIEGLQDIISNINNLSETETKEKSLKYIFDLEEETQKIQKMVDPINENIQKLVKEEQSLYNQIKLNYPELSDQEILKQIQNELKKRNLS